MAFETPQRWQRSYASEIGLEMTEGDVEDILANHLPDLLDEEGKFPKSMGLRDILKFDGRRRIYKDEEIIVRKGDYGSSVFVILSGQIRLLQRDLPLDALGRTANKKIGLGTILARVFSRQGNIPEERDHSSDPKTVERNLGFVHLQDFPDFVLQDSIPNSKEPVLNPESFFVMPNPYAGTVFGELAALGRTPRTVTVLAKGQTELLEIRWQGLREIRRFSDSWRKMIDDRYRKYSLETTLNSAPFTKNVWDFHQAVLDRFREMKSGLNGATAVFENMADDMWLNWMSALEYAVTRGSIKGQGDSRRLFQALFHELTHETQEAARFFQRTAGISFAEALKTARTPDDALKKCADSEGLAATLKEQARTAYDVINCPQRIAPNFSYLLRETLFESYGKFEWFGSYKQLAEKSAREKLREEPVIARQGDYPNGLILVRGGFARVSQTYNYGEKTASYLGKGSHFAFREIYANYLRKGEGGEKAKTLLQMGSSLRAIGYTDVLVIPTEAVERNIIPLLTDGERQYLEEKAEKLQRSVTEQATEAPAVEAMRKAGLGQDVLEFLLDTRAINGTASMLIDLNRCTRCDDCVRACSDSHDGNPRFTRHGRTHDHIQLTNACMHCADPVCMIGCPTGAISRNEIGGQVIINDTACIGCATCANSCPYDNIQMVEIRDQRGDFRRLGNEPVAAPIKKATKCDLCASELTGPACMNACPHDALIRVNLNSPTQLINWLNR